MTKFLDELFKQRANEGNRSEIDELLARVCAIHHPCQSTHVYRQAVSPIYLLRAGSSRVAIHTWGQCKAGIRENTPVRESSRDPA
jgi:hypothetical protein